MDVLLLFFSVFSILSLPGSTTSSSEFIVHDFAIIMIVAAIMLFITHKLKQSMVIGYLIAGMIIGPYTPPFTLINEIETVNIFAELGKIKERTSILILGILIVEDIVAVSALAILQSIAVAATNTEEIAIFPISISIAIAVVFIGSIL